MLPTDKEVSERIAEIESRSLRLPSPRDYWKGRPPSAPFLPANILLFSRTHASGLLGHHPDQHHRFVLITNLVGEGKVGIDAQVHVLRQNQSLLIFPFQPHFYTGFPSENLHWIFISFECPRGSSLDSQRNRGSVSLDEDTLLHLRNLLKAWQMPTRQPELPLHLSLWLHSLIRGSRSSRRQMKQRRTAVDRNDNLVERANNLLFQNRSKPLSTDQMAAALGYSVSLLRKRFREATGRSIGRHAREIRLSHACELLCDTGLRIEEISARCGYESLFAFSRAFHNAFGRTASQYRKERFYS